MSLPELTIGIEEEYQIIDPDTRGLAPYVEVFLEEGRLVLQDQIKPEFMQSQVEVGTRVCRDMKQAREELIRLRGSIMDIAERHGVHVAAASTHPFAQWQTQPITVADRYTKQTEVLADLARRLLIFGMHVHVGIPDPELRIAVMNQARYFVPHLLALSTSSPFWHGRETGLKSYRSIVFSNLPRTGLPPEFSSFADYNDFIRTLVETNCIDEPTKIWWDIRPHPKFPTIEFRAADMCTTVDEAICVAALTLAMVTKLIQLRLNNQSWRSYRHHLITENKWRAVRWGLDGDLIDFGKQTAVPARALVAEMLDWVDDVVDELGIRDDVAYAHTIMANGTSADRQLATFKRTGNLKDVVDRVVVETRAGVRP